MLVFEIPENKDEKLIGLVKTYYKDSDFEILKDLQAKSRILVIKTTGGGSFEILMLFLDYFHSAMYR